MVRIASTAAYVALVIVHFSSCGGPSKPPVSPSAPDSVPVENPSAIVQTVPPPPPPPRSLDVIFSGAGDIADCKLEAESTARILDRLPGSIFTLGDHAYPSSTPETLAACYEPTWGRHRARTYPAPGNHDWRQSAAYFACIRRRRRSARSRVLQFRSRCVAHSVDEQQCFSKTRLAAV